MSTEIYKEEDEREKENRDYSQRQKEQRRAVPCGMSYCYVM